MFETPRRAALQPTKRLPIERILCHHSAESRYTLLTPTPLYRPGSLRLCESNEISK
jgi:hypothetical protein